MSKQIRRLCILAFLPWAVLISPGRSMADAKPESQAAAALFNQFETVFYLRSNLISGGAASPQLSARDSKYVRFPFAYLLQGLDSLGSHASDTILQKSEALLVGAKDFRSPAGLGTVSSKRCYVIILAKHTVFDLSHYFHQAPTASAASAPVWNWSTALGEFGENDPRPSSLFAAQVASSYLVVSNDLAELEAVVARLDAPSDSLEVLSNLRDWDTVRDHKSWGYRRYRHDEIAEGMAAGMSYVTTGATGLIFFADLDKKTATIRLLCSTNDERTVIKMNSRAMFPPLKSSGFGTWQRTMMLSGDEQSFERMFAVMCLFGFAVFV
jgi:hypothetical protein